MHIFRKLLGTTKHWRFMLAGVLVVVDIVFFGSTDPNQVSATVILLGFGCLVLTMYALINVALSVLGMYGLKLTRHRRRLGLFISIGLGGLLALQSIGELSVRDGLVIIPLITVLYGYISYTKSRKAV